MKKFKKNSGLNKYELGKLCKNSKKQSNKSCYLFEETKRLIESIDYNIKINSILDLNLDNKMNHIYNETINIINNISKTKEDDTIYISYNELEILIRLYVIDEDKTIKTRKINRDYSKFYKLYYENDNHDKLFNAKLYKMIKGGGSGILPKLVSLILNNGNQNNHNN